MWNPDQYLRFSEERTRPSLDLAARIPGSPRTILDAGCGPGNSTEVLRARWPGASILGLDSSPEMIAKARALHPSGDWAVGDLRDFRSGPFDLVFSNAVLQWIPGHETLLSGLLDRVAEGGHLAVQLPSNARPTFRGAVEAVAALPRFQKALLDAGEELTFHDARFYYDLLAPRASRLDLWETTYFHVLGDHQGIVDWMESTGLRPYLSRLADPGEREAFKAAVRETCRATMPLSGDGKVLMPFERLFFVARK